jgi:hypothetical protein
MPTVNTIILSSANASHLNPVDAIWYEFLSLHSSTDSSENEQPQVLDTGISELTSSNSLVAGETVERQLQQSQSVIRPLVLNRIFSHQSSTMPIDGILGSLPLLPYVSPRNN